MFYLEEIPLRNLDELKLLNGLADFSEFIEDNRLDIEVRIQFRRFSTLSMQLDLDFLTSSLKNNMATKLYMVELIVHHIPYDEFITNFGAQKNCP